MISVEEARQLVVSHSHCMPPNSIEIVAGLGAVLAEDIPAPMNVPPFNQSAMDGYALRFCDHDQKNEITVEGEVAAGQSFSEMISDGKAVRIFTGAELPDGTDTVVMQEKANVVNGKLIIDDQDLVLGANVRLAGAQIEKGKVALKKGTVLNPGAIGYLTAMGIDTVKVIAKPKISIIVTGSELQKPGTELGAGKIFESNSYAVHAALRSIGIEPINICSVIDDEVRIFEVIKSAIQNSDIVLITGGISVGDYDFVGSSLQKIGLENVFYKIKQKPGKPLFFGKYRDTLVYGLPGNPASVLSCFYEYVYPAIRIMEGKSEMFLKTVRLPLGEKYKKKTGLSFFLKGKISEGKAIPLEGQESFILSSFAEADCLIYLPAEIENPEQGDMVEVHLLPSH